MLTALMGESGRRRRPPGGERGQPRRWLRPLLGICAVVAIAGIAVFLVFLVRWTSVTRIEPSEVDRVFAAAVQEAGGGEPLVEIADNGVVTVHRERPETRPRVFDTLTVLAWAPNDAEVLRVDCPRWFVRLKTASSFNLGTMISIWRQDWGRLDLNITYDDLKKHGPGLILDHRTRTGARILLWTAANGP